MRTKLPDYYNAHKQRKEIIEQVISSYPKINKKTVFYFKCKKEPDCYPFVLPFQSGFGHTLMVIYYDKTKDEHIIPFFNPFLEEYFLWDPEHQGYKEVNGYGFGFYREYDKLEKIILEKEIVPNDVIAFTYDKITNKVEDISKKTREELLKGLENEKN